MKFPVGRAKAFLLEESGPTVTEYAIMLALIVLGCVAAIGSIGGKVDTTFTTLDSGVGAATGS